MARRVVVRLAAEVVVGWLCKPMYPDQWVHTDGGIPPDARCVGMGFDPERNCVWVAFEHESFAEVAPGETAPRHDGVTATWQWHLLDGGKEVA